MAVPAMPDVCDLYRPFGAGAPHTVGLQCRIVPDLLRGRGAYVASNYLQWTHWVDLLINTDVRDGCSRGAGTTLISYSDGDGIKATLNGSVFSWVVVWVEQRFTNTGQDYKRAYLVRDSVTW